MLDTRVGGWVGGWVVYLLHFRMDVEARVAQLSDLLRQELDPIDAVAEDNGLVDLQLGR